MALKDQLDKLADNLDKIAQGLANALYVYGPPGHGKTHTIEKMLLEEHNIEPHRFSGTVTAPELYKLFVDHNGEIIILDDISGLLSDDQAMKLFMAAFDKKGEVTYKISGGDYPDKVKFTGAVVSVANDTPNKPKHKPYVTRNLFFASTNFQKMK